MDSDFSVRTSQMYDDRDGMVVTTLTKLIKVCDGKTPKMAFFVVHAADNSGQSPQIDVIIEGYARMMDIPEPLRQQVREALGLGK